MSSDKTVATGGGIGFWGLLLIVLITLKLTKLAEITWFAIGCVALAPLAIALSFMLLAGIFYIICHIVLKIMEK